MKAKKKHVLPRKAKPALKPVMVMHPTFAIDIVQPPITIVIKLSDWMEQLIAAFLGSIVGLIVLAAWLG